MSNLAEFTTPDGVKIAYLDEGEGLPVIALAGLTRNHRDFDFIAPHLDGIRLIRPDYRGRGASDYAHWETYNVPQEGADVIALMDHLGVERAAFLGTSRGGIISLMLAATHADRVIGVCLNDVGPVIETAGLDVIDDFIGRNPKTKTFEEYAKARAATAIGFEDVPMSRWIEEVERTHKMTEDGMVIDYDPALRESFRAAIEAETANLWPLFDALAGKPVASVHGAGSDLLSDATVAEMQKRRPDMIYGRVPGRGHVPFLDEPEALAAVQSWLDACR